MKVKKWLLEPTGPKIKYCLPDYKPSVKSCAPTSLDRLRYSQCKTKIADCGLGTADCGQGVKCTLSAKYSLQNESTMQAGCKMQNELHTSLPGQSTLHIHQKFQ